jgi:hypothetical protein
MHSARALQVGKLNTFAVAAFGIDDQRWFGERLASGEDRGGIALGPSSRLTVSDVELAPIPGQEFI